MGQHQVAATVINTIQGGYQNSIELVNEGMMEGYFFCSVRCQSWFKTPREAEDSMAECNVSESKEEKGALRVTKHTDNRK